MNNYPYLIIGGGMTAYTAIQGIYDVDPGASIGLFSMETHPPYSRPPLTKGLWKGRPLEKIWMKKNIDRVELHLGQNIVSLDVKNKKVQNEQGETYDYDKLLLATGGQPRRLPFGSQEIIYYRTLQDYEHLRLLTGQSKHFLVIGGGFTGSEIAAALAMNGEKVSILFIEDGIGARVFPHNLSVFINEHFRQKGVEVIPGSSVTAIDEQEGQFIVKTDRGLSLQVDHIIAGLGIIPDTRLATTAGINVDNGIMVDEFLRTNQADIYAAGDVASIYNNALGTRMRVEHEDNALMMGNAAGKNMALQTLSAPPQPYDHLPFFYSDLFDLGYEAVGETDPRLETFCDWQEPFQKGVIYYLADGHIRGVLMWNVWGQVDAARQLIADSKPFSTKELKNRIPFG